MFYRFDFGGSITEKQRGTISALVKFSGLWEIYLLNDIAFIKLACPNFTYNNYTWQTLPNLTQLNAIIKFPSHVEGLHGVPKPTIVHMCQISFIKVTKFIQQVPQNILTPSSS